MSYKKSEILLFSGGLDSFILYHYLNKPKTLYFNLGHRYAHKEIKIIFPTEKPKRPGLVPNTIMDFSFVLTEWERADAHIPFRNILLAMGASRYADVVYIGGVVEDRVNDNTPIAHADMTAFISRYAERYVQVRAPFTEMGWSKFDAVRWFKKKFGRKADQLLLSTLSCFHPVKERCMACPACFRWWVALKWCKVKGVPEFENLDHARKYVLKAEHDEIGGERGRALRKMVARWIKEKTK